jgi:aspartate ammonia-lyase
MSRFEKDSLGEKELDDSVYYGVQTARAIENFPVTGQYERKELITAYIQLKKASARANISLGVLDEERGNAIVEAADEALAGKFDDQFKIDVFQAGAGTSFNMNTNEILANRALEILGKEKGDYTYLSPNDHVNMAQSSNDTFPTASHMAAINAADGLLPVLKQFSDALIAKGKEFENIPKSGRTHLEDALPVTLGYEFRAYGAAIQRASERISQRRDDLLELPIGGTATGTGANAHPNFRETVIANLTEQCSVDFQPARDSFEAIQSRAILGAFSSAMKELALELIRIANDIRLLGSGPTSGISEIILPAVQPGSSIMPGKVNPVMAECLNMISFQIAGNDSAVAMAVSAGQFELNVMTPVIIHNILQSTSMLTNFLPVFVDKCIIGIEADEDNCRNSLEKNPALATLLNPKIGYLKAAEVAKEALVKGVSIRELAVEKGLITEAEADEIFEVSKMARSIYD